MNPTIANAYQVLGLLKSLTETEWAVELMEGVIAELEANEVQVDPIALEPKREKKKRVWTDEQRAAAAERMRARNAVMRGEEWAAEAVERVKNPPERFLTQEEVEAKHAAPRQDTPPEKLIKDHDDYAGQREEGILEDSDWGDIRRRIGRYSERAIASEYAVSISELQAFIKRKQSEDLKEGRK